MRMDAPSSLSLFDRVRHAIGLDAPLFACTKATLMHLSHTLEAMVRDQSLPAVVMVGFQDVHYWHQSAARYRELADHVPFMALFARGEFPPESQLNVVHVSLPDADPLSREWFMVVAAAQFSVVFCGKEQPSAPEDDGARLFETVWSFDPAVVQQGLDLLGSVIAHYRPDEHALLHAALTPFPLAASHPALITRFTVEMIRFEEHLQHQLRTTTNALRKQLHWRDDVVTTLVHDMRTPLSSLMLALDTMDELSPLSTDISVTSRKVAHISASRLQAMLQLILDTNTLEAGQLTLRQQLHPPQKLLDKGLASLTPLLDAAKVRVTTVIDAAVTQVWGDDVLLARVIENLVSNAIKFTHAGDHITVAVRDEPATSAIALQVHDTGRGIAAHAVAHIFNRYYQGDPHDGRGSGLGLYFCKLVTEAHQGSIHVATQINGGTTFTIMLPAPPAHATNHGPAPAP